MQIREVEARWWNSVGADRGLADDGVFVVGGRFQLRLLYFLLWCLFLNFDSAFSNTVCAMLFQLKILLILPVLCQSKLPSNSILWCSPYLFLVLHFLLLLVLVIVMVL